MGTQPTKTGTNKKLKQTGIWQREFKIITWSDKNSNEHTLLRILPKTEFCLLTYFSVTRLFSKFKCNRKFCIDFEKKQEKCIKCGRCFNERWSWPLVSADWVSEKTRKNNHDSLKRRKKKKSNKNKATEIMPTIFSCKPHFLVKDRRPG